jgi:hypothetical protein
VQLSGSEFIRENIHEWKSTFDAGFRSRAFFVIYIEFCVLLVVSTGLRFNRARPSLLLLTLGFWVLTIVAVRHIPWFVIAGCYLLAGLFEGSPINRDTWYRTRIPTRAVWAILSSLLLLAGANISATHGNVRGLKVGFENGASLNPTALAFIEDTNISGNVFNSYGFGDQLVYHFYPRIRVAMDSRLDAYGSTAYLEFRRLTGMKLDQLGAPKELLDYLEAYAVQTIVTRPREYTNWSRKGHKDALTGAGWREAYRDRETVILTRR